ncbi:MAG: ABC transporter substrate-binding protein [Egibacteraceae bacterium]
MSPPGRAASSSAARGERAGKLVAGVTAAVEELRAKLPVDPATVEVALVYLGDASEFLIQTLRSFQGKLLERVGLGRPAAQRDSSTDRVRLSTEELERVAGDVILVATEDEAGLGVLAGNPVWQNLDTVQRGDVHQVPGFLWLTGGSALAAHAMLDDLRRIFT